MIVTKLILCIYMSLYRRYQNFNLIETNRLDKNPIFELNAFNAFIEITKWENNIFHSLYTLLMKNILDRMALLVIKSLLAVARSEVLLMSSFSHQIQIIIFSISTKCIHGNTLWHETHISKCKHWVILLSVDVYHTMMDLSILYSICKSNL